MKEQDKHRDEETLAITPDELAKQTIQQGYQTVQHDLNGLWNDQKTARNGAYDWLGLEGIYGDSDANEVAAILAVAAAANTVTDYTGVKGVGKSVVKNMAEDARDVLKSNKTESTQRRAEIPIIEVKTSNAVKGTSEYEVLNSPPANTHVKLDNGTEFKTNASGYVDEITFNPMLLTGVRDSRQTAAGKEGISTDVGGHIQACSLGGTCDRFNLFPQDANFNNSMYKKWENEIRSSFSNGDRVGAVTVKFNRNDNTSARPDSLVIEYSINNIPKRKSFNNESSK
ncbi:DNA/RNA non-specific endonuclease [Thiothrix fructosivorans]|uniref:DNA/RNA non-specific endonuclease n=1 Tax=Thiothrix fructosivorans TaxID=111770 RepID=A0A8B0SLG7_9GAMM|nr:DNA/RNA non-specific endonuclease [Thiothrix fructosivorans]MBO0612730.1 DNA/RNA non-specific endonuclease [Thiothrix fructosivorans]QTX11804.1 DNA/RNA non-specific endonuclease [Thiothrix fructosivorans]